MNSRITTCVLVEKDLLTAAGIQTRCIECGSSRLVRQRTDAPNANRHYSTLYLNRRQGKNVLNQEQLACIRACNECVVACLQCASECLKESDPKAMARCIALAMECADFCRMTASSVAMGGEHINAVCALCAVVCQTCANECAKHPMAQCQICADACEKCAAVCRAMS